MHFSSLPLKHGAVGIHAPNHAVNQQHQRQPDHRLEEGQRRRKGEAARRNAVIGVCADDLRRLVQRLGIERQLIERRYARACEDAGADAISLINTIMGMRIDLKTRRPAVAGITGGLSGEAIRPVALRMVYQVYEAVKIPVVGIGGVSRAEDVLEMMLAGATAVQVGAANLVNPFACRDIVRDLPAVMEKYGVTTLTDIIGGAH